jgi:multidrug efflux system outer membrane protein
VDPCIRSCRNIPANLALLLAALSVAGCTIGPTYKRPDSSPPAQFRAQIGTAEANSLADLPWWEVFQDKALQALIGQALRGNYDLQIAIARIDQARAQLGIARSDYYPQISYGGGAARQKSFVPGENRGNLTYNAFSTVLNAVWELDIWGRVRHATEAAQANLMAQAEVRRGVMLTLVSDVAALYFSLLELDREKSIAQESASVYKQTVDLFTQRFEAGRDTKLAVVRAQAAYDDAMAKIAALNQAIGQEENALSVLLGAYPRAIERGVTEPGGTPPQQVPPLTPVGLTTDMLQRRPDIQAAEQVMIGANAEIGGAITNFFPVIGLSALVGGAGPRVEDQFKKDFSVWSIGGFVTGPLFQGGRLRATYRSRQAFWDESIAQYRKTVLIAFQETSNALIAQQSLVAQRAALQDQANALKEAVDLAVERYKGGRANYYEVLEAEQLLYPAQTAVSQTARDQLVAVVNLYKALGGGWKLSETEWRGPQ